MKKALSVLSKIVGPEENAQKKELKPKRKSRKKGTPKDKKTQKYGSWT